MLAWLLNLAYLTLIAAIAPVLLFRTVAKGKYRTGWAQKLWGAVPERSSGRPCIWLHAVSVGEVIQLQPVLEALALRQPGYDFVVSTTTATGQELARKRYPTCQVIYFPLDFSWAVRRALRRINPSAVVLVELELWPNFIIAATDRNIPVLLINGRISERSFRGYCRIKPLMAALLQRLKLCAVQNETYGARLLRLGASPARVRVTGSIKFDRIETDRTNPKTQELRHSFGLQPADVVFIAGSTQGPEEEFAIESYLALREKHPRLRLIVVPRHRERFEEVAGLVEQKYQLPLLRRSKTAGRVDSSALGSPGPILLLDTLGELSACWGLADVAFVGGSLTNRGGQNMIEPAGFGAAVLLGPNTQNFRDVVEALLLQEAASVVRTPAELTQKLDELLTDPAAAAACGARAQNLVSSQRGATDRTVDLIGQALPMPAERRSQRAA